MYASHLAQNAYAPETSFKSARDIEYDAFARITGALKRATSATDRAEALHKNRQLWTILAIDVADKGNALPASLRAEILSLAQFTMQHTSKVLAGSQTIDALVEINTSMMRGLRGDKDLAA